MRRGRRCRRGHRARSERGLAESCAGKSAALRRVAAGVLGQHCHAIEESAARGTRRGRGPAGHTSFGLEGGDVAKETCF